MSRAGALITTPGNPNDQKRFAEATRIIYKMISLSRDFDSIIDCEDPDTSVVVEKTVRELIPQVLADIKLVNSKPSLRPEENARLQDIRDMYKRVELSDAEKLDAL